jgi:rubrerythrin
MHPYRCLICGETYLGSASPDRCPFCGADRRHLVAAAEWVHYGPQELTPASRDDVVRALQLELNNTSFYTCARHKAQNEIGEAIFARLAKQESEHAELLAEMLGIEMPEPPQVDCADNDEANFIEAHGRERRAQTFYREVAGRAPEARMQQVFYALAEIETEHLKLSNLYR